MQGCINKTSGISFMGTFVYTVSLINENFLLHEQVYNVLQYLMALMEKEV